MKTLIKEANAHLCLRHHYNDILLSMRTKDEDDMKINFQRVDISLV